MKTENAKHRQEQLWFLTSSLLLSLEKAASVEKEKTSLARCFRLPHSTAYFQHMTLFWPQIQVYITLGQAISVIEEKPHRIKLTYVKMYCKCIYLNFCSDIIYQHIYRPKIFNACKADQIYVNDKIMFLHTRLLFISQSSKGLCLLDTKTSTWIIYSLGFNVIWNYFWNFTNKPILILFLVYTSPSPKSIRHFLKLPRYK